MRPQVHHLTQLIIALFWNIYYLSCGCPDNPLPSIQLVAPPLIAGNYPIVDEIEGGVVELLWKRGKAAVNLVCAANSFKSKSVPLQSGFHPKQVLKMHLLRHLCPKLSSFESSITTGSHQAFATNKFLFQEKEQPVMLFAHADCERSDKNSDVKKIAPSAMAAICLALLFWFTNFLTRLWEQSKSNWDTDKNMKCFTSSPK